MRAPGFSRLHDLALAGVGAARAQNGAGPHPGPEWMLRIRTVRRGGPRPWPPRQLRPGHAAAATANVVLETSHTICPKGQGPHLTAHTLRETGVARGREASDAALAHARPTRVSCRELQPCRSGTVVGAEQTFAGLSDLSVLIDPFALKK